MRGSGLDGDRDRQGAVGTHEAVQRSAMWFLLGGLAVTRAARACKPTGLSQPLTSCLGALSRGGFVLRERVEDKACP